MERAAIHANAERNRVLVGLPERLAKTQTALRESERENERLRAENIALRGELDRLLSDSHPMDFDSPRYD